MEEPPRSLANRVGRWFRPGASVGLVTGASEIVEAVKNGDDQGVRYSSAETFQTYSGTFRTFLFGKEVGQCGSARASVFEASAGVGRVASVGASALSVGAFYESGVNNTVGVDLTVARVHGNLGPVHGGVGLNFGSHASVSPNGFSMSFLGWGFSLGPSTGVSTPFFDVLVNLF